ncbi:MAG: hypothetical protein HGGPFJEG_00507 [Ignavibacteria bacterium]|nr:hypothetical protein [Ignavibacteria bacterium]
MKIKISNLQDGEHNYDFIVEGGEIDLDDVELFGDISVKVNLYKSGNQFDLKINVSGRMKFECDRCLDEYGYDFANSYEMIYKFDFTHEMVGDENESDDIRYLNPNTAFIDLKNDVRDFILLSVPLKHAPEEKDGVCTLCKRNIADILKIDKEEEINPVWEQLLKIKTK